MVLLENCEHILPSQPGSKVALYGSGAVKTIKGGSGSGDVNERETISIWAGMKNAGYEIVNEDWLSEYKCLYEIEKKAWRDRILEITGNRERCDFIPDICKPSVPDSGRKCAGCGDGKKI